MFALEMYKERKRQERRDEVTYAYLNAKWTMAKKPPSLETILKKLDGKEQIKQAQTPEQMLEYAKWFMANLERREQGGSST